MNAGARARAVRTLASLLLRVVLAACGAAAGIASLGARTLGAQVTIALGAPATVAAASPVLVRVEVTAPVGAAVRLTPPSFAPFTLVRSDRTPGDTAGLGGRERIEWRYVLRATGPGTFAFEPFEAYVTGRGVRATFVQTRAWTVAVTAAAAAAAAAAPVVPRVAGGRAESTGLDPGRLVFDARVDPERVYVGQQATLELRVAVGARLRERLRRSPEFAFPSVDGVVAYDLAARHASTFAGDAHVYRRALFPLAPGEITIGSAQLAYALSPDDDPFGTEERQTARSPVRRLEVVPPPTAGRPASWDGAVGRYRATARADTAHARVGDVVVYTVRLEGTGNVGLLPRPPLDVPWADASPGAERVTVDSSGDLAGGAKEFDWLLTPRAAGEGRVPAVHYAYFDPQAGTYGYADAPAVEVRVAPGAVAVAPAAAPTARSDTSPSVIRLGVLRRLAPERAAPAVTNRTFWLALAAVPLPAVLWTVGAATTARRRARRALGDGRAPAPPDTARQLAAAARIEFLDGLGALLGVPGARAIAGATVARTLRRAGVSASLAAECGAVLGRWEDAAYGVGAKGMPAPHVTPTALLARIDRQLGAAPSAAAARPSAAQPSAAPPSPARVPAERWSAARTPKPRAPIPRAAYAAAAVALALAAVALAAPQFAPSTVVSSAADRARAAAVFEQGVTAYAAGDAARARDLFSAAAAAAPRAADAWANAGTAAWTVGDTAGAAFAWQRAARLAPDTPGLRARLEQLPAVAAVGRVGAPPPADANRVGGIALALGALAAAAAVASAARARGDAAPRWRLSAVLYAAAVATAALAALDARASDPRGLAVVRAAGALRPEPTSAANGSAAVVTGEVARVTGDEGEWVRVRLDRGRNGWLRAAQLAPLDATP